MRKLFILFFIMMSVVMTNAQESNNGKRMWAKSFLNKKAPKLVVEKWLTEKPDIKGKFVLVDFWATWCQPCLKGIPELNEFHSKFKDKLVVIGLAKQTESEIRKMKKPIIEYYSAIDTQDRMGGELKIKGIPHVILIDPKGIVRWEGFPMLEGYELTEGVLKNLMEKYK